MPRLFEVVSSRALVDDVEGIPLLDIGYAELSRFNMGVKRIFDLVVGSLLFLLMLPAMVALAIIVKVDSRGPVSTVRSVWGAVARLPHLQVPLDGAGRGQARSELAEQNEYSGPMFKMKEDPRITRMAPACGAGAWTSCPRSSTCSTAI